MASITYNNNNNFTSPITGIVQVECWGAGGGGGSTSLTTCAGGGAGGGGYGRGNFYVKKGDVYRVIAAAGGANGAGNANGVTGVATLFGKNYGTNGFSVLCRGAGGIGGNRANTAGAGGTVANSIGQNVAFAGGAGAAGVNATKIGGGGGAGAGNANAGAAASGATAGSGANGGGTGGTGGASGANGTAGSAPGGGGGGGGGNVTVNFFGGPGGAGACKITYNAAVTVSGNVKVAGVAQPGAVVMIVTSDANNGQNAFLSGLTTSDTDGNWTTTVPGNQKVFAMAQHNNVSGNYTGASKPFVGT